MPVQHRCCLSQTHSVLPLQVQELLGGEGLAELQAASSGAGFSGLAVTVLRRVLRVAASAKMEADAKTAVAAYVAGTDVVQAVAVYSRHPQGNA